MFDLIANFTVAVFSGVAQFLNQNTILGIPILHYFIFFGVIGAIISLFFRSAKS